MSKSSLTWNDRLALIQKYSPSDDVICSAFGVTADELRTARDMERAGTFVATTDLDLDAYADLFGGIKGEKSGGSESITKPESKQPPATATKKTSTPKKRGRKGDKIIKAFEAIPASATPAESFASNHGVSLAVLRQSKRFDRTGTGTVRVKKDKSTKQLMIWREAE